MICYLAPRDIFQSSAWKIKANRAEQEIDVLAERFMVGDGAEDRKILFMNDDRPRNAPVFDGDESASIVYNRIS
ncbi:MAG TPA: hypothetical protein VG326_17940 [Tepidisphaeraceae bacterium]|nr:hypothetical protein [Tepidisphaeraceae bacterium]